MAEQGAGKPRVVSIRLSPETHKRAKRYAIDHDTSLQAVVAAAVEAYVGKQKRGA